MLTGVDTAVALDAGFVEALESLSLTPAPVGDGETTQGGAAVFPITGGNVTYGVATITIQLPEGKPTGRPSVSPGPRGRGAGPPRKVEFWHRPTGAATACGGEDGHGPPYLMTMTRTDRRGR